MLVGMAQHDLTHLYERNDTEMLFDTMRSTDKQAKLTISEAAVSIVV